MEDEKIIQLYWERQTEAIPATAEKYGRYCHTIAYHILGNYEDAEECVNDTWLNAWNAIPPQRPDPSTRLKTFLGTIARNLSFNLYRNSHAEKRGGGEIVLALEELGDCVSGQEDVEGQIDRMELVAAINQFLEKLPEKKQNVFVCRYWYADPVKDIASRYRMTDNQVSVTLSRLRSKLKVYLQEQGFQL